MNQKVLLFFLFFLIFQGNLFAAKTYKIGCNKNYYPYITENSETKELEGVVIDWWKLWAQKANVEIEFVSLDLGACLEQVKTGEIDAIAGLFFSDERAEELSFSEPLLRMKNILFLKKGINPESIETITHEIGVLKDDFANSFIKENHPNLKLEVFDNFPELQKLVQEKNISGFVYDVPDPLQNYQEVNAPSGYYKYKTLYNQKLRPAVKTGNKEMQNLIVSGATKISDEELAGIAKQWEFFKPNRFVMWVLAISSLLIGIVLALFLNHFVRSRRKMKVLEDTLSKTDWELIIDKGENDQIEFKSSLRWDMRLGKPNKALEKVIAKTISAFLNTNGGMLFIGVDDDGNILGLDNDYNTMGKKNRDGFLLSLTNNININLGKSVHKFLTINIISINDKDVCIVNVEKSDKPVFMGSMDKEEFYIRASASSQPLGVRETYKYINSHWN